MFAGTPQVTFNEVCEGEPTAKFVGTPGTTAAEDVVPLTGPDHDPQPAVLQACTSNEYAMPAVRPVQVKLVPVPADLVVPP
jgi:hypothetical protein